MTFKVHEYQVSRMLSSPNKFPWDLMGMRYPRISSCHAYLCEFLSQYSNGLEQSFMKGKPTFSELENFGKIYPDADLIASILRHNRTLDSLESVSKQVLGYLRNSQLICTDLEERVNKSVRSGSYELKEYV